MTNPANQVLQGLATFILLVCVNIINAQNNYEFENISTDQGLSNGWVRCVLQDSKGFLWFGTNLGLNRYDGYQFKVFQPSPETEGAISNGAIWCLHEDQDGKIWIGTDGGLKVYDPQTERFTSYESLADSLGISKRIRSIAQDNLGNIWLATYPFLEREGALIFFDQENKIFQKVDEGGLTNRAQKIVFDEYGNLWLGATGAGIKIFDPVSKKLLKHIYYDPKTKNTLTSNEISSLLREKDNTIWATTWDNGISKITYDKGLNVNFENFTKALDTNGKKGLGSEEVTSIIKDKSDNLWISTPEGISIFNSSRTEITNLTSIESDPNSLKESNSWIVFEDKTGVIWIGHANLGISKLKNNKGFIRFSQTDLSGNNISAIHSDSTGNLWVGVADRGLYKIDFHQNYLTPPDITAFPTKLYFNSILINPKENIWISADGYYQLNRNNGSFQPITPVRGFNGLFRDSDKNFWVGSFNNLFKTDRIDLLTPDLKPVMPDPRLKSLQVHVNFSYLLEDHKRRVWISNWQGELFFYDLKSDRPYMPQITTSVKVDFDKARISTFYLEKKDYLWVATLEGILKYKINEDDNPEKITLHLEKVYRKNEGLTTPDGRESLNIHSIQDDHHGNLWIAHTGMSVLNPASNSIKTYYMDDGLPSNQITGKAKLKNGYLAYGSNNGVILFHPDSLKDNTNIPSVVITDFQLLRQSVPIKVDGENKNFALNKSIIYSHEITVPYDSNVIGFEFAALDFRVPTKNQYYYQMVGFDADWIYADKRRTATYTNLDPGSYTFRVKGSNNDGLWNNEATSIKIIILPPPWKTWWAYSLYVIFLLLSSYLLWNRWLTRSRLKTLALIKSAEAEKLRELDTLKSNFFANISHEFRTPLTLLLGPLQKRLDLASDSSDKKEFSVMHRNASRLLTLVNQLLDLSRLESGNLKLKCIQGDLRTSIQSVSSQFSSIADSREIQFDIIDKQEVILFYDQDKLEKIVTNLLSNAFKFTPAGGSITVTITQQSPTENFKYGYAEISIADTGTGIESEHLSKIFDRFYQADMSTTRAYEGSGIGLSLTKELIELHHGSISVTSTAGKGSTFSVKLPMGDRHLKPEEIQSDNVDQRIAKSNGAFHIEIPEDTIVDNTIDALPRLLLVEDNADLRYYIKENLKQFNLLEAEDGEKGIAMALNEVPDLIISDLMMPKMNGLQLCQQLKEDEKTSHIPIILLTAKADLETKLEGYRHGADDYIAKPFQIEELLVRIESLILNRKRIQEKFSRNLTLKPSTVPVTSIDERFIKRAMEIVEKFISDSSFGVELFAQEMGVSSTQLYRKLRAITGYSPNEFIRQMRLLRAADLMRKKAGNVAEVAYQVGFNNLSYFSKVFKEKFGVTPIEFLKNPITITER